MYFNQYFFPYYQNTNDQIEFTYNLSLFPSYPLINGSY